MLSRLLTRFSLDAAKFNWQVFVCLAAIWLILVGCAVFSINSQGFSDRKRRIWLWVVTCVPLLGILAYLPFAVRREDLPQIVLLMLQKDRLVKKAKKSVIPRGERLS